MKRVMIIGAGISGLTTAYWLTKKGIPCELHERSDRVGGLINTHHTEQGLVETAANGFMGSQDVLEMIHDLNIPLAERRSERKYRFIFRYQPRKWPLSLKESLQLGLSLFKHLFSGFRAMKPKSSETIAAWGRRCFGDPVLNWLIAPALQGVYAGRVDQMSAELVFGSSKAFSQRKAPRGLRGTLAPENGMVQWIHALEEFLKKNQVPISLSSEIQNLNSKDHLGVVVATEGWSVRDLQVDGRSVFADFSVEALPLVSVTTFFEPSPKDIQGFGCLFPKSQGFYSLGVLFNSSIFSNRSSLRSETWILGGALNKKISDFGDAELLRQIQSDRRRLLDVENSKEMAEPVMYRVQKWSQALPHMTLELKKSLEALQVPKGVYLTGNYLGRIGLSQIVSRNKELASQIAKEHSNVS